MLPTGRCDLALTQDCIELPSVSGISLDPTSRCDGADGARSDARVHDRAGLSASAQTRPGAFTTLPFHSSSSQSACGSGLATREGSFMSQKPVRSKSSRPIGRQTATPRRAGKAPVSGGSAPSPPSVGLAFTHDTVASLRPRLVPGHGGKPPGDEDIDMTQTAAQPATELPTLADQKSDFTAEGSPPPGKVSTSIPLTPHDDSRTGPAPPAPVRGTSKRKRTSAA